MTDYEIMEMPPKLELICEEKIPSVYSFSSYSNSICSDSTIDLDAQPGIQDSNHNEVRESKPLQNNFLNVNLIEQPVNGGADETDIMEPSIEPPTFSKSVSLHDVSNITPLNLTAKSKSNTVSCETINSQSLSSTTKSKDSGFQRSLSCLSLTSGKRSYDHVQSKVKAYIKNIKESEALNKKNKLLKKLEQQNESVVVKESQDVGLVEKDVLLREIQDLKHDLHEKSLYIDAQQRNYNKLLLKFAEARNIIDKLRVQSMSLSYSDEKESKNHILSLSNINLDTLGSTLNRSLGQLGSCIVEEEELETSNYIGKDTFKPILHSSPFEKSLSPVRQIFSSSSRLDKNYQPLTSLTQSNLRINSSALNSHGGEAFTYKSGIRNSASLLNNHSNLQRRQSMNIDLPNDDPFDKVKKWQASLPSINLLGSHTSSDCEDPGRTISPTQSNPKKSDGCCTSKCFTKTRRDENEICNELSQELQNKCIITEMDEDIEQQEARLKINQNVKRTCKKDKNVNTRLLPTKNVDNKKKSMHDNNERVALTNECEVYPKRQNTKSQNCLTRGNSVEVLFPSPQCKGKLVNAALICSRESSFSDGDSTHVPKSSSISQCRINKLHNDDDYSDDSSSISSSVLGSDSFFPQESHKRTKRRLDFCQVKVLSKVPKTTKSKSSQTTFVLKEPRFSFTSSFENSGSQINNQISKNKSTNNESCLMHRNPLNLTSMNTESSQRKAWNARNNTNFYVCKDFPFSKSASLMECIREMEGLISKGTFVISTVIDRNNTTC